MIEQYREAIALGVADQFASFTDRDGKPLLKPNEVAELRLDEKALRLQPQGEYVLRAIYIADHKNRTLGVRVLPYGDRYVVVRDRDRDLVNYWH